MGIESPTHLIFIAIIALIVLGPKRLPDLARSLGHGIREFRQALDDGANSTGPSAPQQTVTPAAAASSLTPTPPPPPSPVDTTAPVDAAAAPPPSADAPAAAGSGERTSQD